MEIKKEIFRAYDIRGKYPGEVNEEFAYLLGRAYVRFLKNIKKVHIERILVNCDTRASSPALKKELIRGITEEGISVLDGGVSTTPMHYFGVGTLRAQAGVMVTASHSTPDQNGFKLSTKKERIASETGLFEIVRLMQGLDRTRQELFFGAQPKGGAIETHNFLNAYVSFLKKFIDMPSDTVASKLRIVIDASAGAAGAVLEKLLPHISIKSTELFFAADQFKTHNPNPLLPESQAYIKKELSENRYDFGVLFDGDADRAVFFNEIGGEIPSDVIGALIASKKLERVQEKTVLFDVNASRRARQYIIEKGGVVRVIRVGTAFFRNELERDQTVIMGTESSGHYYYPEFFNSDAAILTFLHILNLVFGEKKSLSELARPLMVTARSGELNYSVHNKTGLIEKIKQTFSDGTLSFIDGIVVEYSDWWLSLRPSNTDPVIRMHIEADTKELLDEKKKILENLIISL